MRAPRRLGLERPRTEDLGGRLGGCGEAGSPRPRGLKRMGGWTSAGLGGRCHGLRTLEFGRTWNSEATWESQGVKTWDVSHVKEEAAERVAIQFIFHITPLLVFVKVNKQADIEVKSVPQEQGLEEGGWGTLRETVCLPFAALPGLQMKSPEKKRRKSNTQVNERWLVGRSVHCVTPLCLCLGQVQGQRPLPHLLCFWPFPSTS